MRGHPRKRRTIVAAAVTASLLTSLYPGAAKAEDDTEKLGLLAYLGLEAASGDTEVKGEAGKLEASILMAPTLNAAADHLFKHQGFYGTWPIIPLVGGATLDMRALAITQMRLDAIKRLNQDVAACPDFVAAGAGLPVKAAGGDAGEAGGGDDADSGPKLDTSTRGLLSNTLALLKTDTSYSGIALTANAEMVLNALVNAAGNRIFIPGERMFLDANPYDSELAVEVARLRPKVAACNKLKEAAEKAKDQPGAKEQAALAKTRLGDLEIATTLASSLIALGEKGAPSLIEQAGVLHHARAAKPKVLRVDIASAGGTMVQRKNVWTTLGIDKGISLRGGIAMGWRLIDPETGYAVAAGTIICASPIASFENVYDQAKSAAAGSCHHASTDGVAHRTLGGGLTP